MPNLFNYNRFHLVGIKGVAMSALSLILVDMGKAVTGSDTAEYFKTEDVLLKRRIIIKKGFSKEHIKSAEVVIYGASHHSSENIEVLEAIKKNKPVYCLAEVLGLLSQLKTTVAVCGCHGKTTTTALLAYTLRKLSLKPSYLVGTSGFMNISSGQWRQGKYFVIEADEYLADPLKIRIPKFLFLKPQYLIVTNTDFDHPDFFNNQQEVNLAYLKLFSPLSKKAIIIANHDDPNLISLLKQSGKKYLTYGKSKQSDYYYQFVQNHLYIYNQQRLLAKLAPELIGEHNYSNLTAVCGFLNQARISLKNSAPYLNSFKGASRRSELIGKYKKSYVYDDYAHHPKEISATVTALRNKYPTHKIALCFQPHTYSRTIKLFNDFVKAFSLVDYLALMPIFSSAREKDNRQICSLDLLKALPDNLKSQSLNNPKDWQRLVLRTQSQSSKWLYITMGAGNINSKIPILVKYLKE